MGNTPSSERCTNRIFSVMTECEDVHFMHPDQRKQCARKLAQTRDDCEALMRFAVEHGSRVDPTETLTRCERRALARKERCEATAQGKFSAPEKRRRCRDRFEDGLERCAEAYESALRRRSA